MTGSHAVTVEVALVGNVTETVYATTTVTRSTIYKDPDLFLGFADLAIPFHPITNVRGGEESGPSLDPEDTKVVLRARPISADTRLGQDAENSQIHLHPVLLRLHDGTVEIPSTVSEN